MRIRTVLVAAAVAVVVLAAFVVLTRPQVLSRFTAEGRRARLLRSLERNEVVVRRSCFTSETFVASEPWARLGEADQRRAAEALGTFCAEQSGTSEMTIVDAATRRKLAHWNGTGYRKIE
jgi:hypothetical protein